MITMRRQLLGLGFVAASSLLALHAAQAMSGPTAIQIDGGPLGPLQVSGGADGYFYGLSGTQTYADLNTDYPGSTTNAGTKQVGAYVGSALVELQKTSGIVQYTIEVGSNGGATTLGYGPTQTSVQTFSTGPLYAGYITIAPPEVPVTVSVGMLASLEGWESGVDWNNANQLTTTIFYTQNSQSRGVLGNYTSGPVNVSVSFGDGYNTGVFNFLQFLGTYTINSTNAVSLYGGANLGKTGLNAHAYGSAAEAYDQVHIAAAPQYPNSDMIGGFYNYTMGSLNLVPEVQIQYAKPQYSLGIQKGTGNFGAAVFADYSFGTSPYSLGGFVEYFNSHSSAADAADGIYWFYGPNAAGEGISVTPTWQYKDIFARADLGGLFLNRTSAYDLPRYGYGNNHSDSVMFQGTLEAGVLF